MSLRKKVAPALFAVGVLLGVPADEMLAQSAPAGRVAGIPQWLHDHMDFVTRDGGKWITDNSSYKSDQEPFDSYSIQWEWGLGGASIKGKLYGLIGAVESATFWEFRLYWDAGKQQAIAMQFGGDGTVGYGPMWKIEDALFGIDQMFYSPDGSSFRARMSSTEDGDSQTTNGFDYDGNRPKPGRSYVWHRSTM